MENSHGGKRTAMLAALLLAALVTMVNTSIASVALPTIARDLNASGTQIHFIADGFSISLTALVLLFGAMGDTYGRKLMFVLGLSLMIPSAVMCSLSSSPTELILWLMASGAATAMLFPTTLSAISEIYSEPAERARAVALWTGTAAAGAAVAPIISGWMLERFSWGSVFLVSVPVAAITLILGVLVLPPMRHKGAPPVDWLGGALSAAALGSLLVLVILGPVEGWVEPVPLLAAITAACTAGFVAWQLRAPHPLLDLRAFRNRSLTGGSLIIILLFTVLSGVMFLSAQYTQSVLDYSTFEAGVAVLPLSLAVFAAAPVSALLVTRIGPRNTVSAGSVLVALGALSGLWWGTGTGYPVLLLSFVLFGVGLGLAMTPSTSAILDSLPPEQQGIASAVNDVTRDFGSAFGVALMGAIASVVYSDIIAKAYATLSPAEQGAVPEDIYRQIRGSLSGALAAAAEHPGQAADKVVEVAREAFVGGQGQAAVLGVLLSLACLGVAWFFLPKKVNT